MRGGSAVRARSARSPVQLAAAAQFISIQVVRLARAFLLIAEHADQFSACLANDESYQTIFTDNGNDELENADRPPRVPQVKEWYFVLRRVHPCDHEEPPVPPGCLIGNMSGLARQVHLASKETHRNTWMVLGRGKPSALKTG
jgi:hypothetical protein